MWKRWETINSCWFFWNPTVKMLFGADAHLLLGLEFPCFSCIRRSFDCLDAHGCCECMEFHLSATAVGVPAWATEHGWALFLNMKVSCWNIESEMYLWRNTIHLTPFYPLFVSDDPQIWPWAVRARSDVKTRADELLRPQKHRTAVTNSLPQHGVSSVTKTRSCTAVDANLPGNWPGGHYIVMLNKQLKLLFDPAPSWPNLEERAEYRRSDGLESLTRSNVFVIFLLLCFIALHTASKSQSSQGLHDVLFTFPKAHRGCRHSWTVALRGKILSHFSKPCCAHLISFPADFGISFLAHGLQPNSVTKCLPHLKIQNRELCTDDSVTPVGLKLLIAMSGTHWTIIKHMIQHHLEDSKGVKVSPLLLSVSSFAASGREGLDL